MISEGTAGYRLVVSKPALSTDHGRHALTMLRLALLGLAELENTSEEVSDEELREVRAFARVSVRDAILLLDLYLTDRIERRKDDENQIVHLVYEGQPWLARLSNEIGSVIRLSKPSQEKERNSPFCVCLDLDGPLDPDIQKRWKQIDKDARPDASLVNEISQLLQRLDLGKAENE